MLGIKGKSYDSYYLKVYCVEISRASMGMRAIDSNLGPNNVSPPCKVC